MMRFTLRAHLQSPVILRGAITLDALLMAVLGRGDVRHLLHCDDGLYHASAAHTERSGLQQRAAFVASMRPEHSPHWLDVIAPNNHAPELPTVQGRLNEVKIGVARQRTAGNILNGYTAHYTALLEWYAVGDGPAVFELLRQVPFVGKRRTSGYGEVTRWEVEEGELDGLVGYDNAPLRPIPVERWHHGGDWVPMEAAWKAPYWDVRNRTQCFVPEVV